MTGSNCVPEWRFSSFDAASKLLDRRYGRSDVTASTQSATANTRALTSMSAPTSPRGYPVPSHRSWCSATTGIAFERNGTYSRIARPNSVWSRISPHSSGVKGAGFSRIASRTPIFPTSCSSAPRSRPIRSSRDSPISRPSRSEYATTRSECPRVSASRASSAMASAPSVERYVRDNSSTVSASLSPFSLSTAFACHNSSVRAATRFSSSVWYRRFSVTSRWCSSARETLSSTSSSSNGLTM